MTPPPEPQCGQCGELAADYEAAVAAGDPADGLAVLVASVVHASVVHVPEYAP